MELNDPESFPWGFVSSKKVTLISVSFLTSNLFVFHSFFVLTYSFASLKETASCILLICLLSYRLPFCIFPQKLHCKPFSAKCCFLSLSLSASLTGERLYSCTLSCRLSNTTSGLEAVLASLRHRLVNDTTGTADNLLCYELQQTEFRLVLTLSPPESPDSTDD